MAEHPVISGIDGRWPAFLGYQRLKATEDAQILVQVENDPFLVVAQRGRGRVAAMASDMGPHWATDDFLNWEHYDRYWTQLLRWVGSCQ
jgi:uncharacterized membrane protein